MQFINKWLIQAILNVLQQNENAIYLPHFIQTRQFFGILFVIVNCQSGICPDNNRHAYICHGDTPYRKISWTQKFCSLDFTQHKKKFLIEFLLPQTFLWPQNILLTKQYFNPEFLDQYFFQFLLEADFFDLSFLEPKSFMTQIITILRGFHTIENNLVFSCNKQLKK